MVIIIKDGKVYPMPKKVLDSIPGAYKTLDTLITSFDSVSAIEQTTGLTSLFEDISKSVGDGAFALHYSFRMKSNTNLQELYNLTWGYLIQKK